MTQLDTPSEQPDSIRKHHASHPKEKVHSTKDPRSPEATPVPEPPWGDPADPVVGSDWLE
jgi:hypothetical protein